MSTSFSHDINLRRLRPISWILIGQGVLVAGILLPVAFMYCVWVARPAGGLFLLTLILPFWIIGGLLLLVPKIQFIVASRGRGVRLPTARLKNEWTDLAVSARVPTRGRFLLVFEGDTPPSIDLYQRTLLVSELSEVDNNSVSDDERCSLLVNALAHHAGRHAYLLGVWRVCTLPQRAIMRAIIFLGRRLPRFMGRIATKSVRRFIAFDRLGPLAFSSLGAFGYAYLLFVSSFALLFLFIFFLMFGYYLILITPLTIIAISVGNFIGTHLRRTLEYRADAVTTAAGFGDALITLLSRIPSPQALGLSMPRRFMIWWSSPVPPAWKRVQRISTRLERQQVFSSVLEAANYEYRSADYSKAHESFERACKLASDNRLFTAIALEGLARTLQQLNRKDEANKTLRRAMKIYKAIGVPQTYSIS